MRTVLSLLLSLTVLHSFAQRECATQAYLEQQILTNSALERNFKAAEHFISQQRLTQASRSNGVAPLPVIKIPVVVHIVYNADAQNISDEQVRSGIEALNRDFNKQNADTANIPDYFKALAANVQIEFALATADPLGRKTTGIVRQKTNVTQWSMDDKIKFTSQGGSDAWDGKSYLNIWVGSLRKLLGYASAPGSPAEKDGVVINTTAFGTVNTVAPYNLGRTTVHEVGHWLGLRHIWGDAACGNDLVDDTPPQANYTMGCPTGIRTSCGNGPTGEMYMNYMDFTNDACINMFTQGQKERMRTLFNPGGPRYSLLSSKGLNEPWYTEAPLPEVTATTVAVYPNPVLNEIILNFGTDATWMGKEIRLVNSNGALLMKIQVTAKKQRIVLGHLKPGIYFLAGENGNKKMREKIIKL